MAIAEISFRNFMCFDENYLNLTNRQATVITGSSGATEFLTAIRFVMDPSLSSGVDLLSLAKGKDLDKSYVKIKLKIQQDNTVSYVTVMRSFSMLDFVFIIPEIGEKSILPILQFQKRFKTDPTFIYPFIDFENKQQFDQENLLHFFTCNDFNCVQKTLDFANNLSSVQAERIFQVAETRHIVALFSHLQLLNVYNRIHYCKIFVTLAQNINSIFMKLTNDIYSIRFVIKTENVFQELVADLITDETFFDIVTLAKTGDEEISWTSVSGVLKLIIKIATTIAIAVQFDHTFVIIDNIDKLRLRKDLFLDEGNTNSQSCGTSYMEIKFIQNIVDLSERFGLQMFLKYNGDDQPEATNCNILFCEKFATPSKGVLKDRHIISLITKT